MKTVRMASGSGYWGATLEPAIDLVRRGNLDYIGFDYLAELTMSLLQRTKMRDPKKGYITDIIPMMKAILPIAMEKGTKIILNGGGANPEEAATQIENICKDAGIHAKIAVVVGDDVLDLVGKLEDEGYSFTNLDTGETGLSSIRQRMIAAHAYLGSDEIVQALRQGADVVVAGRVSDNALYVAPLIHEFGWEFSPPYWDRLGAGVTVGHIIECAECVTGGMSVMWRESKEPWNIGFPIAECSETADGKLQSVITKLPDTGGIVNEWTVKEHLLYEVHDPSRYLMPDAVADFTSLQLTDLGNDRVQVTNMTGRARPDTLKVQIGYTDGWIAEGRLGISWPDAWQKTKRTEEIIRHRLEKIGVNPIEIRFDYAGINMLHGSTAPLPINEADINEIELRVALRTETYEQAEAARHEFMRVTTSGPVGIGWGTPVKTRQVVSLFPTLLPREFVKTDVIMREV